MTGLYFDCFSGVSGDMMLGALLDLGISPDVLTDGLERLGLPGFRLEITKKQKCGIYGTDVDVIVDGDMEHRHDAHGHSHDHGCGQEHGQKQGHVHGHEAGQMQKHAHGHGSELGHTHEHVHRTLADILDLIERSTLSAEVKELASRIFWRLARAEAKVHNAEPEKVHFHEVGAVDSIVDIVGASILLVELGCDVYACSALSEGRGFVRCQHGLIPVPVPAVTGVLAGTELRLNLTDTEGEMVTPTGAAILAELCGGGAGELPLRPVKTGYGVGKKDFDHPNLLRAMLFEVEEMLPAGEVSSADASLAGKGIAADTVVELRTNLDDVSPEILGFVMERLMEAGAKDAFYVPCYMKKGRPAYVLHVVCGEDVRQRLERVIFEETHTLGIRRSEMRRTCLPRSEREMDVGIGTVRVKEAMWDGETFGKPEFEDLKRLARQNGIPLRDVMDLFSSGK